MLEVAFSILGGVCAAEAWGGHGKFLMAWPQLETPHSAPKLQPVGAGSLDVSKKGWELTEATDTCEFT